MLEQVRVDTDSDGDPVTSCVIVEAEGAAATKAEKFGGNQKVIWDALGRLLTDAPKGRPAGAPATVPEESTSMTVEEAVKATRGKLTCEVGRQEERTRSALSALRKRGLITVDGGWLWITNPSRFPVSPAPIGCAGSSGSPDLPFFPKREVWEVREYRESQYPQCEIPRRAETIPVLC